MEKRDIPVYQVSGEYADCLEKAFAPGAAAVVGAASEAKPPLRGVVGGAMSITPLSSSLLGTISEDTVHLSVWVDWGSSEEDLFARLSRCQRESQGKIGDMDSEGHPEGEEYEGFSPVGMDDYDSLAISAQGDEEGFMDERYVEGHGSGYIEFGESLWKVMPYGKGGGDAGRSYYKYQLVGAGVRLFFRRDRHETVSNMWIEIGSIPLCVKGGLAPMWKELLDVFEKEGIVVEREIVSRVDIYSDFDVCGVDEFCRRFYENHKVTRARKISKYSEEEMNTALYMVGSRHTGFSIGTNIKLRCYDKRYELRRDPIKWGVFADRYNGIPDVLTRIEFQLRRNALKDFSLDCGGRIEGVESYLLARESLWRYLTGEWFRLTEESVDKKNNHQSRARTWIFWEAVQNAVSKVVDAARRLSRKIQVDPEHLFKMGMGCICKAAILANGGNVDTAGDVIRYFKGKLHSLGKPYYLDVMEKHYEALRLRIGDMLQC